jgi:uncharacterized protein
MKKNNLVYNIASLKGQDNGASIKDHIEAEIEISGEKMSIDFDLELMRLEDTIIVMAKDIDVGLKLKCVRCLKAWDENVHIEWIEREFLENPPEVIEDEYDVFLINTKLMEVDMENMLRQEILLHFPDFPICSPKCKGLCNICGANKNDKDCGHEAEINEEPEEVKPFKDLKNLLS